MSIIRPNTCKRCKWSTRDPELECRRFPPQINAIAVTGVPPGRTQPETVVQQIATFPRVQDDSWCGEFTMQFSVIENSMPIPLAHTDLQQVA